ncbi:MAG: prepilin peptidase [Candidatus Omnitrophica bacterium]|nr:prepilin peptidase [Candidatus Omnitrophota bacterium]MDD5351824.1 prepilin peptidase [Candidatus Omnitrophota bacterium]MDD5550650.1 prepilin peptidase [Candidatus Omnitrophota bacterium]
MAGFIFSNFDKVGYNFFIFVLGLVTGSFLNVCIYRLPREQSVVKPRSRCPHCKKTIAWYDNIPLLSYIMLRGKCRNCSTKIPFQYFIVELLTAFMFLWVYNQFGFTILSLIYIIFICGLIIATFVDFNFRIIPDEINIGGIILGLVISFIYPYLHNSSVNILGLYRSFLGIIIGGGIIWITGIIGDFVFKKETMGGGDVKLLAMIGAFLGWKMAILTFFIAPIFGAIVGIIIKLRTKNSLIAYGPYLSLASVVVLFWGENILMWILFR